MQKVIVTGGSGFVGRNLRELCPDYIYISRSDVDLTDTAATIEYFSRYKGYKIVHLAALVGGLFFNQNNNLEMYEINTLLNTNVLKACKQNGIKQGVALLSTCIYPDKLANLGCMMKEEDIHDGLPHSSNIGYALAKRNLDSMIDLYNLDLVRIIPGNLYGPFDDFESEKSHVVPALLRKFKDGDYKITGSKHTKRQFVFVNDLCNVIKNVIDNQEKGNNLPKSMNVVGDEHTLNDLAKCICDALSIPVEKVVWTSNESLGQHSKKCRKNEWVSEYIKTSLSDGIKETATHMMSEKTVKHVIQL